MSRFARFRYAPVRPLGKDGRCVTASKKHLAISKEAAIEGTVLLKNDGTLPLKAGARVCLFGRGAGEFIFGGGGSGNVLSDVRIGLAEALEQADEAGKISLFRPLITEARALAEEEMKKVEELARQSRQYLSHRDLSPLPISEKTYREAVSFGGVAIFSILRYSTEDTRFGDRETGAGGFGMYPKEKELLERLTADFESVVVILTVCGPMETKPFAEHPKVGAVLYPVYGGSFAGQALTEILLGERYPSGHLQDTLAEAIEDYPTTATYLENESFVNYEEDIFVGYRYFETFCPEKVVYPFGFGLSYTTFERRVVTAEKVKNTVKLTVKVTNTGSFAGKEVLQAYLSAPQGKLGKPAKVLCAFAKTRELQSGDSQTVTLSFDLRESASYDDVGKVYPNAFVLEKGDYTVFVGNSVRNCEKALTFTLAEDQICRKTKPYLAPKALPRRLLANGTYETLPEVAPLPHRPPALHLKTPAEPCLLTLDEADREGKLKEFVACLTDRELGELLHGHSAICAAGTGFIGHAPNQRGVYGNADPKAIPPVPTADGPAGLRTVNHSGVFTTFFPAGNTISQSWNLALARRIGTTAAREVKENNCGIWLAPAMNIHRSPLCGRNFEYYSEDPLAAGLVAAAVVKGVQSEKISATVKHFACNNKEVNRKLSDSRVSQRALREIYLKGFEIAVKKADPWCIMSSYNLINGTHASANHELLMGILKGEWHYKGVVMTDWWTFENFEDEFVAGSDVKMPYRATFAAPCFVEDRDVGEMIADGTLSRATARAAAYRVLRMFTHFE